MFRTCAQVTALVYCRWMVTWACLTASARGLVELILWDASGKLGIKNVCFACVRTR